MRTLLAVILACIGMRASASKNFANEVMAVASNNSQNFTNQVTMSCWLYRFANANTIQGICAKGRTDFTQPALYIFYFNANKLVFTFANPDGTWYNWTTTATYPQTNTPIHVACEYQYSLTNTMKVFVNGVSVAGAWDTGAAAKVGLVNANDFQLGIVNTTLNGISARFSEFAIWNAYLTDAQIANLAAGVKRVPLQYPEGLVAYYPMDDGKEPLASNPGVNIVDYSPTHQNTAAGAGIAISEQFQSYPPNE